MENKGTYTPARKVSIYKWRTMHHDQFKEYQNKWATAKYYTNVDRYRTYARDKYRYDTEAKRLRNILFNLCV